MLSRARPGTLEAIVRDLGSRDFRVRVEAAEHATSVVGEDAGVTRATVIAALIKALTDEHERVRSAAAIALADLGASEALPALLTLADDDSAMVRQMAITALGELGDARAHERIRRALGDPRPEVRFQAMVAFPRIALANGRDNDEIWNALAIGIEDEDPFVRSHAAEACAEIADGATLPPNVADRLARRSRDEDETIDTRVASAIALGESGDARAAPTLLAVARGDLKEKNPRRVQAVFELLGELRIEEARAIALEAAFSFKSRFSDPSRRSAALVALIRLGEERAVEHVLSELEARAWERKVSAIGIVVRTSLTRARAKLEALRSDPMVGEMAVDALAQLP